MSRRTTMRGSKNSAGAPGARTRRASARSRQGGSAIDKTWPVPPCLRDEQGFIVDAATNNYAIPTGADRCYAMLVDAGGWTGDPYDDLSSPNTSEIDNNAGLAGAMHAGLGIGVTSPSVVAAASQTVALVRVLPDWTWAEVAVYALLPAGRNRIPRVSCASPSAASNTKHSCVGSGALTHTMAVAR